MYVVWGPFRDAHVFLVPYQRRGFLGRGGIPRVSTCGSTSPVFFLSPGPMSVGSVGVHRVVVVYFEVSLSTSWKSLLSEVLSVPSHFSWVSSGPEPLVCHPSALVASGLPRLLLVGATSGHRRPRCRPPGGRLIHP